MISLTRPTLRLYDSWAEAVAEFGGAHLDGSSIPDERAADTSRDACEWLIQKTHRDADTTVPPPEGLVHADAYWMVEEEHDGQQQVVGFIQLRHVLNDFLREVGGHIGYAVRPSRRREGHASRALALVLDRARELGLTRVMISCRDDNPASYRTIEGNGGVLQDVLASHLTISHPLRRYWIDLTTAG